MSQRDIFLFGTEEPQPETFTVQAGPVSATFDGGQLRWITHSGVEIIRAIAFLIRDRNWSTASAELSNLRIDQRGEGFTISFDARSTTSDGDFLWQGRFDGAADGTVTCSGVGRAEGDFMTCRTGFVVLHPLAGTVGRPMLIEHPDGSREEALVPEAIEPAQPFFDIRAMTHEPVSGLKATVRMEGDVWETEDQRNWSDASLKTYCRPLALPWPYKLAKGEEVRQTVTLSFEGAADAGASVSAQLQVALGDSIGSMPDLGLSVLPEDAERAAAVATALEQLDLSHLNCRLDLRETNWRSVLPAYRALIEGAKTDLILEVIVPEDTEPQTALADVARALRSFELIPKAVMATPAADLASYPPGTPDPSGVPSFDAVAKAAHDAFPNARIGGGMLSNFTELNRKRPPQGIFDFITHATSALVHAADDRSVMETIETIYHITTSAQKIAGDSPTRIGPSHIGNSFNPYGANVSENPGNKRVTMARVEPRHRGLFGAAWHLGFLAQAAKGGVEAATVASPVGEFGILYEPLDHAQPWWDDAPEARFYPLFHVIKGLAPRYAASRRSLTISDPARLQGLALEENGAIVLWLANLTAEPQEIALPRSGAAAILDEESFGLAAVDAGFMQRVEPLAGNVVRLLGYAVARIELVA